MPIQETRMKLAVDITTWSRQGSSSATGPAAFATAFETVELLRGGDAWAETVLEAAWDLARAATPRGADLPMVLAALVAAHGALDAVPPEGRSHARPRRDA